MDMRFAMAIALVWGAAAQAADPPAAANPPKTTAASAPAPARTPLPNEYRTALNMPDADKTTVIVQGERAVAPLQSEKAQPVGLGAVYSLFRHPTSAWRLFVPDMSAYAPQPGPPDVVPPREFRWGP
jgi:hypothetical protein